MFKATNEYSEKETLLAQIFADASDTRINFFCQNFRLDQLKKLIDLRNMVLEKAEVEPFALNNHQLSLAEKEVGSRYDKRVLPIEDVNTFETLFELIVNNQKEKNKRTLWHTGSLQQAKVSRRGDRNLSLTIVMITLAVYMFLFKAAQEADRISYNEFKSNVALGRCFSTTHLSPMSNNHYQTQWHSNWPGVSCTPGLSFISLNIAAFIIMIATLCLYGYRQNNKRFQAMQDECNDSKYDTLLNEILNPEENVAVNWSDEIMVNKKTCSLRKLALILLLCFDDRMHDEILPNLAKNIQEGKRDLSLSLPSNIIITTPPVNLTFKKNL